MKTIPDSEEDDYYDTLDRKLCELIRRKTSPNTKSGSRDVSEITGIVMEVIRQNANEINEILILSGYPLMTDIKNSMSQLRQELLYCIKLNSMKNSPQIHSRRQECLKRCQGYQSELVGLLKDYLKTLQESMKNHYKNWLKTLVQNPEKYSDTSLRDAYSATSECIKLAFSFLEQLKNLDIDNLYVTNYDSNSPAFEFKPGANKVADDYLAALSDLFQFRKTTANNLIRLYGHERSSVVWGLIYQIQEVLAFIRKCLFEEDVLMLYKAMRFEIYQSIDLSYPMKKSTN